jgi:hypothetical protein
MLSKAGEHVGREYWGMKEEVEDYPLSQRCGMSVWRSGVWRDSSSRVEMDIKEYTYTEERCAVPTQV